MSVNKKVFVFLLCLSSCFLKAGAQKYHTTAAVPKIFAVVIGVTRYKYPSLNDLTYPDKDAQAFYDFLRGPNCGNTPVNQIRLLKNEDATRQKVLEAVDTLASRASANDVLIVYYAGHGTNATAGNFFYLETYDTDPAPGHIRASATSAGDIKESLDNSQAKMVIWITDACNSGRLQVNEQGRVRGNPIAPSGAAKFLDEVAKQDKGGFLYMAACQSQEKSREDAVKKHGVFTYHLIQALTGLADADHNCIVTIKECFDYVRDEVIKDTHDAQHPVIGKYEYNGLFPISTAGNCVGRVNLNSQRQMFLANRDTSHSGTRPLLSRDMDVNSYTQTGIRVSKGETVWITAAGSIHVGPFVGESSPDGRQTGLLGFTLQQYNIVRNFNHAVLMYKLGTNDEWISCGSNYHFTAVKDGELIFEVNDNDQGNNSGAYHVSVKKFN